VANAQPIAKILENPHFSVDIFRIKAYYWIVKMEKAKWASDRGGTQMGVPLSYFLDFCFSPAPKAHSVGHVQISQFLLFRQHPTTQSIHSPDAPPAAVHPNQAQSR